jgi:myo-inositol-1(or 4)-monophosphatase
MTQQELELLCKKSREVIIKTGQFLKKESGKVSQKQIEEKSLNSLVSYVDKHAEFQLVEGLQKLLPEAVFLTEEETIRQEVGEYQWIIDPLDGTTNFLHQVPCFAVSVALYQYENPLIGIVYEPNHNECFYAWQNGGAWLNDKPIKTSGTKVLKDALIATGFPYRDYSRIEPYFKVFHQLMKGTRGIRRYGAAAVDLAYVACGRFDAFFEYGLSPWDVAAGILLVKEAGGFVCDFNRNENYLHGGEMVACNAQIFNETMDIVSNAFE